MLAMDSDRADRVGRRIAEIVQIDPDRDSGTPFADRLDVRQAVTRPPPSRMSRPRTSGGAHSVTVIVPSEGSPKHELRRRATEPDPASHPHSARCAGPILGGLVERDPAVLPLPQLMLYLHRLQQAEALDVVKTNFDLVFNGIRTRAGALKARSRASFDIRQNPSLSVEILASAFVQQLSPWQVVLPPTRLLGRASSELPRPKD